MLRRLGFVLLGLMACGQDEPSGAHHAAAGCAQFSVAECNQHPSCQLLFEDGGQHCGDERIGLPGRDIGYGGAFGQGVSSNDASVLTRDSSVPACDAARCGFASCSDLDIASCKADARCRVIKAWTFDWNLKCRGEEQEVGCVHAEACDAKPALATDAQGRTFEFEESGTNCLPSGFSSSSGNDTLYDLCNPPLGSGPCAGLTYADCDAHPECRDGLGCAMSTPPKQPGACEQRSTAECKADTTCASMAAHPLDAACNAYELVGCITVGRACHQRTTFAKNAAGRVFELSSDCLPLGFAPADVPQVGAGVCPVSFMSRCSALGVDHCRDDSGCELLVGEPLDLVAHCARSAVAFACAAKSQAWSEGALIVAAGSERYRSNGYRFTPELSVYTVDGPYGAATAALLALPSCE